jgi:chaperone modulatory protein CbpM
MPTGDMITIRQYCIHYNIEITFIRSLHEAGLISMTTIDKEHYLDYDQLGDLEKFIRMYHDLEINMEGIEAISHILKKMELMQQEIMSLRNKLSVYEP